MPKKGSLAWRWPKNLTSSRLAQSCSISISHSISFPTPHSPLPRPPNGTHHAPSASHQPLRPRLASPRLASPLLSLFLALSLSLFLFLSFSSPRLLNLHRLFAHAPALILLHLYRLCVVPALILLNLSRTPLSLSFFLSLLTRTLSLPCSISVYRLFYAYSRSYASSLAHPHTIKLSVPFLLVLALRTSCAVSLYLSVVLSLTLSASRCSTCLCVNASSLYLHSMGLWNGRDASCLLPVCVQCFHYRIPFRYEKRNKSICFYWHGCERNAGSSSMQGNERIQNTDRALNQIVTMQQAKDHCHDRRAGRERKEYDHSHSFTVEQANDERP